MQEFTTEDKRFLLRHARRAISARWVSEPESDPPAAASDAVHQKRGCFVTLHLKGNLRGCIGTIEPHQSLLEGVAENAVNAAFRDPRFEPLTREELSRVEIEISVLSIPQKLAFTDAEDLLAQLRPHVDGVILSRGWQRSTFLPQVWEQLPDKRTFLEHLCRKAGMSDACWQMPDIDVSVYQVQYFSE